MTDDEDKVILDANTYQLTEGIRQLVYAAKSKGYEEGFTDAFNTAIEYVSSCSGDRAKAIAHELEFTRRTIWLTTKR